MTPVVVWDYDNCLPNKRSHRLAVFKEINLISSLSYLLALSNDYTILVVCFKRTTGRRACAIPEYSLLLKSCQVIRLKTTTSKHLEQPRNISIRSGQTIVKEGRVRQKQQLISERRREGASLSRNGGTYKRNPYLFNRLFIGL